MQQAEILRNEALGATLVKKLSCVALMLIIVLISRQRLSRLWR